MFCTAILGTTYFMLLALDGLSELSTKNDQPITTRYALPRAGCCYAPIDIYRVVRTSSEKEVSLLGNFDPKCHKRKN